jgi:hypothetical protein
MPPIAADAKEKDLYPTGSMFVAGPSFVDMIFQYAVDREQLPQEEADDQKKSILEDAEVVGDGGDVDDVAEVAQVDLAVRFVLGIDAGECAAHAGSGAEGGGSGALEESAGCGRHYDGSCCNDEGFDFHWFID